MLGSFRKASQSWYAKLLFIPLIGLFAIWGIGDVMRMRASSQPAITVGDLKIPPETVADEFHRDAERLQRMSGGKISIDQIRQMGFLNQTIQRLVTQGLMDQESARLGLAVDDDTVRKQIASIPAFHNQVDAFDRSLYEQALRANGLNEVRFENQERQDILRSELSEAVTEGTTVPDAMLDPIFRYRYERRVVDVIAYGAAAMPAPPAPDDAVLQAYHKDHAAQFMAPERRTLTALVVRASDLASDFKPTDEQIAKAYQDRQAEFTTEETRHIRQAFFADKDSARKLVDAVKGGATFDDAAKAAGKTVDDLGTVERKALPIEAVATAVFAADVPGVAGPVQTPLGWNVFYVADRAPGKVRALAEVRDQIVADLTKEEASNRLNALSTKLEDTIGSGASLEEAATSLNLKLLKLTGLDQAGHGADDKPMSGLPDSPAFLSDAFKTAKGAMSDITPLDKDEGYFVLRVDDVTSPALKPFDSVKDAVRAAWSLDQQRAAAQKAATAAVGRLNSGESAAAVAGAAKISVTEPFLRTGGKSVPAPLAAEAFKLDPGKAAVVTTDNAVYAIRLTTIVPADPKADAVARDKLRDDLEQGIAGDLSQQFVFGLGQDIGLRVNQAVIEQQFSQAQ